MANGLPTVEVKSRRCRRSYSFQIPTEIRRTAASVFRVKWMINYSRLLPEDHVGSSGQ